MFALFCKVGAFAQIAETNGVDAFFVKNNFEQNPNDFYVNILRIVNSTNAPLTLSSKIVLPEGWQLVTQINDIKVKANSKKSVPIRAKVSKRSLASTNYQVSAGLTDANGFELLSTSSTVRIMAKSNWEARALDNRKFIQNDSVMVPAVVILTNQGNVTEQLNVSITAGKELKIMERDSLLNDSAIILPALTEKEFYVLVSYSKAYRHKNFSSNLKIRVSSKDTSKTINFSFVRLNSHYDNYTRSENTPNFIQLTAQNPHSNAARYRLMTKGCVKLDKEQSIDYSFSNPNLTKGDDFFDQSQYNLSYQSKSFEGGIGDGGSNMGKNVSYQKSLYAKYNHSYDSLYTLSGFAAVSPFDGESRFGAGHLYQDEQVSMSTSVGLSLGTESKENIYSFNQEGYIKFRKDRVLTYQTSWMAEENWMATKYREVGYSHSLNYQMPIGQQFRYTLLHRYGTATYPGSERGINSLKTGINYKFPKSTYSIQSSYTAISLNPKTYNEQREILAATSTDKQTATLRIVNPGAHLWGFGVGGTFTNMVSTSQNTEGELETEHQQAYGLLVENSLRGQHLTYRTNLSLGFIEAENTSRRPNIKVKTSATNSNFGFDLEYQDGMAGGDYSMNQRIEQILSIRPFYKKSLFRKNLQVNANAQYNYNFLSQSGKVSLTAAAYGLLRNNWKVYLSGRMDCQLASSYTFGNAELANLEVGVTKGISFSRSEIEYYDVEIVFFKDHNGNSICDDDEEGIGNMMAGISKSGPLPGKEDATVAGHASDNFKYIPLSSNKKGMIKMEYMPEGLYDIKITAFQQLDGYFNFQGSEHNFQLDKNKTVYIPYERAGKVHGQLIIKRDAFSSMGILSPENIRVVAVSAEGKEFNTLTGRGGQYILYVPQNSTYTVSVVNPFGAKMTTLRNDVSVDLSTETSRSLNFIFKEKGRKINFNKN